MYNHDYNILSFGFTTNVVNHQSDVTGSDHLNPLSNIPHCSPPKEIQTVLSFGVTDLPPRSVIDRQKFKYYFKFLSYNLM